MKYVADDGTEFNSEKECLEYEANQAKVLKSFVWYDDKLNVTEDINRVEYMDIIDNPEAVDDYLRYEYGLNDGLKGLGLYRLHFDGYWEYVDDLIQKHKNELQELESVKSLLNIEKSVQKLEGLGNES